MARRSTPDGLRPSPEGRGPAAGPAVPRRHFLELVGAAGGAALLGGCGAGDRAEQAAATGADPLPWVKDPGPFIRHPTNLETRLEHVEGFLTPNELFFVRNHAPTPRIDVGGYRLRVDGDGLERPLELTYREVRALPERTVTAYVECAGNWRGFSARLLDRPARGGQWGTGAVGCAEWTGTPLREVLDRAGVAPGAVDVNLHGLDEGAFNRPMPIDKALDPNTLLVWAMNGEDLPPDHGFPIRAVVPGWAGSNSIKWLGRIEVATARQWVKNNTTSYVLVGDDWPKAEYEPADGRPITTLNVKSTLALPWPGRLRAGEQTLRGFAYSPHGPIRAVEWQADDGPWQPARILEPVLPLAWVRFELAWNASPGSHRIRTRATDQRGNTQPETSAFNEKGYLLNMVLPHPVEVT